jgi:cytochrome c oxidase subunit 6a
MARIKVLKLTRLRVGSFCQPQPNKRLIMSFLPRRALLRYYPAARAYSDTAVEEAKAKWLANQQAIQHHALRTVSPLSSVQLAELNIESTDFWRKMRYDLAARIRIQDLLHVATMSASPPVRAFTRHYTVPNLPVVAVFGTYVYNVEIEHKAHNEHLMAENDGKLPQPPRYEYLNKRNKPFPWGPNSLFFNPKVGRYSGYRVLSNEISDSARHVD